MYLCLCSIVMFSLKTTYTYIYILRSISINNNIDNKYLFGIIIIVTMFMYIKGNIIIANPVPDQTKQKSFCRAPLNHASKLFKYNKTRSDVPCRKESNLFMMKYPVGYALHHTGLLSNFLEYACT